MPVEQVLLRFMRSIFVRGFDLNVDEFFLMLFTDFQ